MIKEMTDKYICNTYNRKNAVFVDGKGAKLITEEGKVYTDFGSGIGINALGNNNDAWQDAVIKQIRTLGHTSNLYYTKLAAILAKKLCDLTGFKKAFFANSGAEANECAIKAARKYSFDKYGQGRYEIISLNNSFHGRTLATLSLTGQEKFHTDFMPFLDGFKYVDINNIEMLQQNIDKKTCAIYLELIQGEGGINVLDFDYVKQIRKICDDNDILMIIDEVQTGNGRTGKLYAYQHYEIMPDIITTAKGLGNGLPISCTLFNDKVKDVLTPGTHGCTFGGNPIICAGAIACLEQMTPNFLANVEKKGKYLKNKLLKLDGVLNVTGMGLMLGVEVKCDYKRLVDTCFNNQLLVLTAKGKVRLLPPLNITFEEIDCGLEKFKESLQTELNNM